MRLLVTTVHLYPDKKSIVAGTKEAVQLKALGFEGTLLLETQRKDEFRRDQIIFPSGTPVETGFAALCDKIYSIVEDPNPFVL